MIGGRIAGQQASSSSGNSSNSTADHGHVGERHVDAVLDGVQQLNDHIGDVLEAQLPLRRAGKVAHVQGVEEEGLQKRGGKKKESV